jgi:hypothetical protein
MGSITDYLEKELLDHICNATWNVPTTVFLGLFTADPTDTGAVGTEVVDGAYTRVTITFVTAVTRNVTQKAKVTFPQATADWGTVTHYGIHDAVSAGNVLAHGALNTSKTVVNGNTPSVATGEVVVSYTAGEISDYLSHKLLDHAFMAITYTCPDTYVALATTDILDTDTGSSIDEPSGNGYAREQVNKNGGSAPTWDVAAGLNASLDNTQTITFTTPSGSWGTITALAIVDAATTGNLLLYENTVTDQKPDNGDTVQISAGDLDLYMS